MSDEEVITIATACVVGFATIVFVIFILLVVLSKTFPNNQQTKDPQSKHTTSIAKNNFTTSRPELYSDFKNKADHIKNLITERGNTIKFFTDEILLEPNSSPYDFAVQLYINGYNTADIIHIHEVNQNTFRFSKLKLNQSILLIKAFEAYELVSFINYNITLDKVDHTNMIQYLNKTYELSDQLSDAIVHVALFKSTLFDTNKEVFDNYNKIYKYLIKENYPTEQIDNMVKAIHNILRPENPELWLNANHEQRGKLDNMAIQSAGVTPNIKNTATIFRMCRIISSAEYHAMSNTIIQQTTQQQ